MSPAISPVAPSPTLPLSSRRPSVSFGGFGLRDARSRKNHQPAFLQDVQQRVREFNAVDVHLQPLFRSVYPKARLPKVVLDAKVDYEVQFPFGRAIVRYFPILGVFRLKGQSKRDGGIIVPARRREHPRRPSVVKGGDRGRGSPDVAMGSAAAGAGFGILGDLARGVRGSGPSSTQPESPGSHHAPAPRRPRRPPGAGTPTRGRMPGS